MLRRMNLQKRRAAARSEQTAPLPAAATVLDADADDLLRAVGIVRRARQALTPIAELDENASLTEINKRSARVGGPEALGMLTRVARLNIGADGSLPPREYERLISMGGLLFDMLQNLQLNWSVIFSLLLTMYISIAVLHSGASAYVKDPDALFSVGSEAQRAWGDLPSFAWPEDEAAQAGLRRGLYVGECMCIAIGVAYCTIGLVIALIMYTAFGMALPDELTKFEFMLNNPKHMGILWMFYDQSLLVLPFAVAFVTARASAVLSLAMFAAASVVLLFFFSLGGKHSLANQMMSTQVTQVRRVMRSKGPIVVGDDTRAVVT